jgi:carbon monoxide dehydrogenase subunit G
MVLSESTPFDNAIYKGTGRVAGEPLSLTAAFTLSGEDGRTTVNWTGESAIAGQMPAAAAKLMEPVARQSIRTLVESIKTALNQNQAVPVFKTEEQ